jgi:hypothetical protein
MRTWSNKEGFGFDPPVCREEARRRRIGVREYWSNWDTRACGGRQPCAVMQSLALGPQVAFLEAADPAANRQGVSQIQASRGYQSSMRCVLQLSTAGGGPFEAPFISEIAAGRQRATTGHLENYGIFGAAPTSPHPDVGAKALVGETLPRLCSARATV